MSDAFDGAGKGFREPSYKAALLMILLIVVVVVGLLLFASGALRDAGIDLPIGPLNSPGLQSP